MRAAATLLRAFIGLALLVRLAVPAGFMPVADAHGRLGITLCTGATPAASMPHDMGGRQKHQPAEDGAKPCAFALLLSPALTPPLDVAPLALPAVMEGSLRARPATPAPGRGLAAPPPPATGPPLLA